MYATVTEWETEAPATPESFNEMVAIAFIDFKELGATNLRFIKTGKNRARSQEEQARKSQCRTHEDSERGWL